MRPRPCSRLHAGRIQEVQHEFTWPNTMRLVGEAKAELYRSNKWKSDLSELRTTSTLPRPSSTSTWPPSFPLMRLPVRTVGWSALR